MDPGDLVGSDGQASDQFERPGSRCDRRARTGIRRLDRPHNDGLPPSARGAIPEGP